jgi:hypothetical protein
VGRAAASAAELLASALPSGEDSAKPSKRFTARVRMAAPETVAVQSTEPRLFFS